MSETTPPPAETPKAYEPPKGSTRDFTLTLGEHSLDYSATAEWMVLRKKELPIAEMFHVFYRVKGEPRPVTFVFNGGPGASSAYLHVGALGPRRVEFANDGSLLAPPTRMVDNQESWLAFTDLVFVDPIGTGFSQFIEKPKNDKEPVKEGADKEFFAVKRDLESLCEFISKFLSKHALWSRPVYIAGESYGGFRVARLARKLQESYGVGLNGAILISPALELSLLEGSDYDVLSWTDAFPSLVLAAVHHGRSRVFTSKSDPDAVRAEAERFASHELLTMLARGLDHEPTLFKMADMLGLDPAFVRRKAGRISILAFSRELLRDQGRVCGLYDATSTCLDPFPDRENFEGADPTLWSNERVFTSGINIQLRETLGVESERDYHLLNLEVNSAWKNDDGRHAFESLCGATDDLRYGMALNPHMKVFVCHGLYDLVTPYFASERLRGLMKNQAGAVQTRCYTGGHMFYSWADSRRQFRREIGEFYSGL